MTSSLIVLDIFNEKKNIQISAKHNKNDPAYLVSEASRLVLPSEDK